MPSSLSLRAALFITMLSACEGSRSPAPGPDRAPTGPITVDVFTARHVYWKGDDNQRKVDNEVELPGPASFSEIKLELDLSCPNDRCDFWDRWGYLGVVNGDTRESPVTEILRFATPFRVGAKFTADVTSLAPLLTGKRRLRVFIDTWVGPGHANGDGWLVDARLTFVPGRPERRPLAVVPIFDVTSFEVGDPKKPVASAVPPRTVAIPSDAGTVELRSFITGHGQGNLHNCAEFCAKTHSYIVGSTRVQKRIWRDDCETTSVQPQQGTWRFPRAGWCPGATALPWIEDVTAAAAAGSSLPITYEPEPYENTCRPDSPACTGCVNGVRCPYDDAGHTSPNYAQSALLVIYAR